MSVRANPTIPWGPKLFSFIQLGRRISFLVLITLTSSSAFGATLPSGFREVLVANGLANPTAMQFAPDGRLFVCEQGGRLRVIKNGSLLSTPFISLPVDQSGERGLLGVAFDPNFSSTGFVYVYYTATSPAVHNRISRLTANGDVAASGSETVIFDLDNLSGANNHNGGALSFGADGTLYVAVGENGNSANAQSMSTVLGKILRINKDGTIPTNNPFYGSTTGKNRAIWALGLRNPFTFAFNRANGMMLINDVGEVTWEEINDGVAGANYGWPMTEGSTSDPRFQSPRSSYNHTGACAITGGDFYSPLNPQFPSDYVNDYFFADYCGWWIRKLDTSSNSVVTFATGIPQPVGVKVSSDGALYYLARGTSSNTGVVYRIEGVGGASGPSITTQPASRSALPGDSVMFSVRASGTAPLAYRWQRNGGDIAGASSPDYTAPSVSSADNGARFHAIVSNNGGSITSNDAVLTVSSNRPPTATITSPAAGALYSGGSVITYAGNGSDPDDGVSPASALTWEVVFHHDTHTHPFMPPTSGATGGSFTIPTAGEVASNVWYSILLTVRDVQGLTSTTQFDVLPRKAQMTLASSPSGLPLTLDGQPIASPITVTGVVGIVRTLNAPSPQTTGGTTYEFVSWSDGGAAQHNIATPAANTVYTATYRVTSTGGGPGTPGTPIRVNFQPATSPIPTGYLADSGVPFGDRGNGQTYGWNADNAPQMRDRNNPASPDQRYDTFAFTQKAPNADASWAIAVPNGTYQVHIVSGDPTSVDGATRIAVNGVLTVSGMATNAARWLEGTSTVTVAAGRLTISNAAGASVNKICFVDITPLSSTAPPPPPPPSSTPTITNLSPTSGASGTSVTITGTNFGAAQGSSTVTFNGTTATAMAWGNASMSVMVPAGATTGPVVVNGTGQPSNSMPFAVTSATVTPGRIGWWGPFLPGVSPSNRVTGMPGGVFAGSPAFTNDGGGSFRSTASAYLRIPDGGAGGRYDWTSGPWSVQVDFAFPAAPAFGAIDHMLLVSKGSYSDGTGWEVQVNNSVFNGRYQIMFESNHGVNSYNLISGYHVVPGAFNRALFVCDQAGRGVWYVNGAAGNSQPCAPASSGSTDLLIGRYSGTPDYASTFPITRVQIWNRALTAAEAAQSTTTDPAPPQ